MPPQKICVSSLILRRCCEIFYSNGDPPTQKTVVSKAVDEYEEGTLRSSEGAQVGMLRRVPPPKRVEGPWALARGAPLGRNCFENDPNHFPDPLFGEHTG